MLAYEYLLDGEWDQLAQLVQATTVERGQILMIHQLHSAGAFLAHYRGQSREVWERVTAVLPDGPATLPGNSAYIASLELMWCAVHEAFIQNDLETARAWIDCRERWTAWSGSLVGVAEGHLLRARLHLRDNDRQAAHAALRRAVELATTPRQPLALILARLELGRLHTAEKRYAPALETLRSVHALAQRCELPFDLALCEIALAQLEIATGDLDSAAARLRAAHQFCEPARAVHALREIASLEQEIATLSRDTSYPAGLSAREVEVLRLVASGLTDAQVAERLFISPRTVGQHLRSVYNKLGVSSRTAATRFAVEHGLQ
jgi:DNA-binding CsgD family transcriptional regulator